MKALDFEEYGALSDRVALGPERGIPTLDRLAERGLVRLRIDAEGWQHVYITALGLLALRAQRALDASISARAVTP